MASRIIRAARPARAAAGRIIRAARGVRAAAGHAGDQVSVFRIPEELANLVPVFHEGLRETGYVEGSNVTIDYGFARRHSDRQPEFAADLVCRDDGLKQGVVP
jgi:hypothetical protein